MRRYRAVYICIMKISERLPTLVSFPQLTPRALWSTILLESSSKFGELWRGIHCAPNDIGVAIAVIAKRLPRGRPSSAGRSLPVRWTRGGPRSTQGQAAPAEPVRWSSICSVCGRPDDGIAPLRPNENGQAHYACPSKRRIRRAAALIRPLGSRADAPLGKRYIGPTACSGAPCLRRPYS